jgi:hypothetical protein
MFFERKRIRNLQGSLEFTGNMRADVSFTDRQQGVGGFYR